MKKAIGLFEYKSIARGIKAADAMIKTAKVDLLQASPVCPGKFLVLIAGDVSSVQSALKTGAAIGEGVVIDEFLLANVHEMVFPALLATNQVEPKGSLGIIETFSAAAAVVAGDVAVKAAQVELIEIRLARGMGGKSFVTFCGDVGSVTAAVQAVEKAIAPDGMLVETAIIPAPYRELWEQIS
jgi:microcompartment protein CcmL/EutN